MCLHANERGHANRSDATEGVREEASDGAALFARAVEAVNQEPAVKFAPTANDTTDARCREQPHMTDSGEAGLVSMPTL